MNYFCLVVSIHPFVCLSPCPCVSLSDSLSVFPTRPFPTVKPVCLLVCGSFFDCQPCLSLCLFVLFQLSTLSVCLSVGPFPTVNLVCLPVSPFVCLPPSSTFLPPHFSP